MGIHTPTKGRILINGIDMSDYDSSVMRSIMGYVFQSAHLFKGSIIPISVMMGISFQGDKNSYWHLPEH